MSRTGLLILFVTALIFGLEGYFRCSSPEFRRPFLGDELETVVEFTLIGVTPSGQQHVLRQFGELYSLPRPCCAASLWGLLQHGTIYMCAV